jgi:hypothetical protein
MSWQRRLLELISAGGALAACDSPHHVNFCGNVQPDPCICDRMPADSVQCVEEADCRANGGEWEFTPTDGSHAPDAATDVWGHCIPAHDASVLDAAMDAPEDAGSAAPDDGATTD